MIEEVPAYVSIIFILTTFASVATLLQAIRVAGLESKPAKLLLFFLPLWIVLQTVLSIGGFYQRTEVAPPPLLLFGVLPSLLLVGAYFLFFRQFIEMLPSRILTSVHILRIPVEITIYWLFLAGLMPKIMTFKGYNFDILSGIFAALLTVSSFLGVKVSRYAMAAFNVMGLALLAIIVVLAALSLPSPIQQMSLQQPNKAVLFFPYVYLPTVVVPIVFASHLAMLYKSLRGNLQ